MNEPTVFILPKSARATLKICRGICNCFDDIRPEYLICLKAQCRYERRRTLSPDGWVRNLKDLPAYTLSKTARRTIRAICVADRLAEIVQEQTADPASRAALIPMAEEISRLCIRALVAFWPLRDLTETQKNEIGTAFEAARSEYMSGQQNIELFTTFAMGALEKEMEPLKQDSALLVCLEDIHSQIYSVHTYFDPEMEQTGAIETAGQALAMMG